MKPEVIHIQSLQDCLESELLTHNLIIKILQGLVRRLKLLHKVIGN